MLYAIKICRAKPVPINSTEHRIDKREQIRYCANADLDWTHTLGILMTQIKPKCELSKALFESYLHDKKNQTRNGKLNGISFNDQPGDLMMIDRSDENKDVYFLLFQFLNSLENCDQKKIICSYICISESVNFILKSKIPDVCLECNFPCYIPYVGHLCN